MKSCLQVCICLIVLSAAAEPVHASPWGSLALGSDGYFYGDNSTADITTQVTWNSSNTGAATIGASTGLATGVTTVPANIAASLKRVTSNSFALTVAPGVLTSISITGPSSVVAGSTAQFLATDNYSDNSSGNVKPVSGLSR